MNYADMSKYRNGREASVIAQTWLTKYKEQFLALIRSKYRVGGKGYATDSVLLGDGYTAGITVHVLLYWLISENGKSFINEAFNVVVPTENKLLLTWHEKYNDMVMSNVIYRWSNSDTISKKVASSVRDGSPETVEIVADTFIGWLNSHVGRCFIREAFQIEIPLYAPDESE